MRANIPVFLVIGGAVAAASAPASRPAADLELQAAAPAPSPESRWYKGNTHTHTINTDGDSAPVDVVRFYREQGYNFLILSDHDSITPTDGLNALFGTSERNSTD